MTKRAPAHRPVKHPRVKPKKKPDDVVRMRRRDDDGGGRPEHDPPEPHDGGNNQPSAPTTPDPWLPEISAHFYGLNWDLEHLPAGDFKQKLTDVLTNGFPGRTARTAFENTYSGIDTNVSLGIGLWGGAARPEYDDARRRGLIALRSSGRRALAAEALISIGFLRDMIIGAVPRTIVVDKGLGLTLTLTSATVSVVLPSTLHVVASYTGWLPSVGTFAPTVETNITFGASGGNLTLTATQLNAGDYGAGQLIVQNLFNPFGITVLILAAIGLGGFVIHNLGSNLPALPGLPALPLPNLSSLLPRAVPLDSLKMNLVYQTPEIVTRGASAGTQTGTPLNPGPVVGATSGLQVLRLPFGWNLATRAPSLTVTGPTSVGLPGGTAQVTYHANSVDLVNPTFAWTIGGIAQPGKTSASAALTLNAHTTTNGTARNFVIGARAVDGIVPSLVAANSRTTHGVVIRPDLDERDPPGRPPR